MFKIFLQQYELLVKVQFSSAAKIQQLATIKCQIVNIYIRHRKVIPIEGRIQYLL